MPAHVQPPPASPAHSSLAARVEGWVQYCEYFHLLDADMQAREFPSPLPASPVSRRRSRSTISSHPRLLPLRREQMT